MSDLTNIGKQAREAARILSNLSASKKNEALIAVADNIVSNEDKIITANKADIEQGRKSGLSESLIDRLTLDHSRIVGIADGIRRITDLDDPIGETVSGTVHQNGMIIQKVRVPLGVIGIIYEARPNVTADAAALCLKSGNSVILRGGKEAINSNKAIADIMREAVSSCGLPADCIILIEDTSRDSANALMTLDELDVLIPRGGAGLINSVVKNACVPVIQTGTGNCHAFVDESADVDMAAEIVFNAKTSRPSVCNALETLLVHKNIAEKALPVIKKRLDEKGTEIRGCERTAAILGNCVKPASEEDYEVEFLDYILAVKVVDSIDEALAHIAKYSTSHSECIITSDYANAQRFLNEVDSAAVYVNASTRFTDGGEFGFGAEIGISTQKLHARGPMGLKELTTYKYIVRGDGQVR